MFLVQGSTCSELPSRQHPVGVCQWPRVPQRLRKRWIATHKKFKTWEECEKRYQLELSQWESTPPTPWLCQLIFCTFSSYISQNVKDFFYDLYSIILDKSVAFEKERICLSFATSSSLFPLFFSFSTIVFFKVGAEFLKYCFLKLFSFLKLYFRFKGCLSLLNFWEEQKVFLFSSFFFFSSLIKTLLTLKWPRFRLQLHSRGFPRFLTK